MQVDDTSENYHSKGKTEARAVFHAQVNDKKHSILFFVLQILFVPYPATEHVLICQKQKRSLQYAKNHSLASRDFF